MSQQIWPAGRLAGCMLVAILSGCDATPLGPRRGGLPNPSGRLYVANQTDSTVYVYDTRLMRRVDSFPAGIIQPHFVTFSPDRRHFYLVSRDFNGRFAKFDAATHTLIGSVATSGILPTALAVSSDGSFAYVCDFSAPGQETRIYKYDLATLVLVDSISTGASTHDIRATSDGRIVIATNMSDKVSLLYTDADSVYHVDIDPDSTYAPMRRKYGPYGLAIDAADSLAYIACLHHHEVHPQVRVLSIAERRIVDSIYVPIALIHTDPGGPTQAALSPDDRFLYLTTQWGNTIVVVRLATRTIEREIPLSVGRSFGVAVTDDGSRVYVTAVNRQGARGQVYVLDGRSHDLIDSVEVGRNPYGIAWRPL